jgi:hypothetical protein
MAAPKKYAPEFRKYVVSLRGKFSASDISSQLNIPRGGVISIWRHEGCPPMSRTEKNEMASRGQKGRTHTPESKKKMSLAKLGRKRMSGGGVPQHLAQDYRNILKKGFSREEALKMLKLATPPLREGEHEPA